MQLVGLDRDGFTLKAEDLLHTAFVNWTLLSLQQRIMPMEKSKDNPYWCLCYLDWSEKCFSALSKIRLLFLSGPAEDRDAKIEILDALVCKLEDNRERFRVDVWHQFITQMAPISIDGDTAKVNAWRDDHECVDTDDLLWRLVRDIVWDRNVENKTPSAQEDK